MNPIFWEGTVYNINDYYYRYITAYMDLDTVRFRLFN